LIYSLLVIKIILGINLITYATRRKVGMDARAAEDQVANNSSIPIGETKDERVSLELMGRSTEWLHFLILVFRSNTTPSSRMF